MNEKSKAFELIEFVWNNEKTLFNFTNNEWNEFRKQIKQF